jgi:prepilin-type N-terminal cleavage/methylation domain-containing protein
MKNTCHRNAGFTLMEVSFASAIFTIVMVGVFPLYMMYRTIWAKMSIELDVARRASTAINNLVYGTGNNSGLRGARNIAIATNIYSGWTLDYTDVQNMTNEVVYDADGRTITATPGPVVICRNVKSASLSSPTNRKVDISVTVARTEGRFARSCTFNTSIRLRNE